MQDNFDNMSSQIINIQKVNLKSLVNLQTIEEDKKSEGGEKKDNQLSNKESFRCEDGTSVVTSEEEDSIHHQETSQLGLNNRQTMTYYNKLQ